jgi:hypothetical protein
MQKITQKTALKYSVYGLETFKQMRDKAKNTGVGFNSTRFFYFIMVKLAFCALKSFPAGGKKNPFLDTLA